MVTHAPLPWQGERQASTQPQRYLLMRTCLSRADMKVCNHRQPLMKGMSVCMGSS